MFVISLYRGIQSLSITPASTGQLFEAILTQDLVQSITSAWLPTIGWAMTSPLASFLLQFVYG